MSDDLDRLEAEASNIDAQATAASEPQPAPQVDVAPPADVAAEVAALLQAVAGMLAPVFPSLATIYTEPTCRRLGEAAAPVMDKYGVSVGGLFDRWGAEITLAATALPVALASWQGIKADMAASRVQAAKPANEAGNYAAERAQDAPTPPPAVIIGAP